MASKINFKNLKYIPKKITTVLFLVSYGLMWVLFQGRKSGTFQIELFLNIIPTFYQHISNFAISYFLYVGICYFWLMMGVRFKFIVLFGIGMIGANFIYELFLPFLNTRDIVDAYFGLAGTIFGFIFLALVHKFGLIKNSPESKN